MEYLTEKRLSSKYQFGYGEGLCGVEQFENDAEEKEINEAMKKLLRRKTFAILLCSLKVKLHILQ